MLLKEPDSSKNFFAKSEENEQIYDLYKSDRLTYYSIAKTTSEC